MPLTLILFDCDGTLVDTRAAAAHAMAQALAAEGVAPPPAASIVAALSGAADPLAALVPGADRAARWRIVAGIEAARRRASGTPDPLVPGVIDAVLGLRARGMLLGIVSGASRRRLNEVIRRHRLDGVFDTIGSADDGPSKPDPTLVTEARDRVAATARHTVMVGDATVDILMARRARVASIGVTWGGGDRAALLAAGADRVIDDTAELGAAVDAVIGTDAATEWGGAWCDS